MREKWRPSLRLVVLAILLTVLALPLAGLFFFRFYENQLVRQTEAELIAQGSVIRAVFAQEVREAAIAPARFGATVPPEAPNDRLGRYRPIEPQLDLATDGILPPRPGGAPPAEQPDPTFSALGGRLAAALADAQRSTLAGFRLLDPSGTVIAGGGEIGRSLAAVEEVRAALDGRYASVLRRRASDQPDPPLYSISRGTRVRVFVALPVVEGGRVVGAVYLSRTPNNILRHLYGERGKVALAAVAVLGATLLVAYLFLRTVSRPMHELRRRTARIAAGDTAALAPLAHHGTREMADLAAAFLDMAEKLQRRSEAIRTFATHLSHELKSPLTAIGGAAELLRDDMEAGKRARFLDNIVADTDRLNRLVRRLLELTRAESADPTGEAASIADALRLVPPRSALTVSVEGDADLRLRISAENLGIVLANLIDNAVQHGAGRIALRAEANGSEATIRMGDDGSGITAANRDRVFEPFFTTRRDTGGTGLGLGIVVALLKAHGGTIELAEAENGAAFRLRLPCA